MSAATPPLLHATARFGAALERSMSAGWALSEWGVSWQVVPTALDQLLSEGTEEQIVRVTQAFLQMKKFEIAELREAYDGVEAGVGGQGS